MDCLVTFIWIVIAWAFQRKGLKVYPRCTIVGQSWRKIVSVHYIAWNTTYHWVAISVWVDYSICFYSFSFFNVGIMKYQGTLCPIETFFCVRLGTVGHMQAFVNFSRNFVCQDCMNLMSRWIQQSCLSQYTYLSGFFKFNVLHNCSSWYCYLSVFVMNCQFQL